MLREKVDKIATSGANVVICQKGIDDIAQHYLSKNGILAVRRVKESEMTKLSKATGGRRMTCECGWPREGYCTCNDFRHEEEEE